MGTEIVVKRWMIILTVFVFVLLAVFFIRPVIIGYGTYQAVERSDYSLEEFGQNVRDLQFDLATTKTNLSLYAGFSEQLMGQFDGVSSDLTACLKEKSSFVSEIAACQMREERLRESINQLDAEEDEEFVLCKNDLVRKDQERSQAEADLVKKETELSDLQLEFDLFVNNMARSICCKEKVDNPRITSYSVLSNKILCMEEGENELNC